MTLLTVLEKCAWVFECFDIFLIPENFLNCTGFCFLTTFFWNLFWFIRSTLCRRFLAKIKIFKKINYHRFWWFLFFLFDPYLYLLIIFMTPLFYFNVCIIKRNVQYVRLIDFPGDAARVTFWTNHNCWNHFCHAVVCSCQSGVGPSYLSGL